MILGLISKFSFSKIDYFNKAKELILFYYLLIARGRRDKFMSFPKVLAKNATPVVDFVYHDENRYATNLKNRILFYFLLFYNIPIIEGYLMPNRVYTYILDIYDS